MNGGNRERGTGNRNGNAVDRVFRFPPFLAANVSRVFAETLTSICAPKWPFGEAKTAFLIAPEGFLPPNVKLGKAKTCRFLLFFAVFDRF
jgi:hypothetical protein